ncbi:MAG: hypothetical protein IKK83_00110 [Clostridia bacterium]|nr:hypothetical protein [Clostridia bacterium]
MNKTLKCMLALVLSVIMLVTVCVGCSKDAADVSLAESGDSSTGVESVDELSGISSDGSTGSVPDSDGQISSENSAEGGISDLDNTSNTESNTESIDDEKSEGATESTSDGASESTSESIDVSDSSVAESVAESSDIDSSQDSTVDIPSVPNVRVDSNGDTSITVWATDDCGGDAVGKFTVTAPQEVKAGDSFEIVFKWTDYSFDTGFVGAFACEFAIDTRYAVMATGTEADITLVEKTVKWVDASNFGNAAVEAVDKSAVKMSAVALGLAAWEDDAGCKNSFTLKVRFKAVSAGNCSFIWNGDGCVQFCDSLVSEVFMPDMSGCDFTVKVVAEESSGAQSGSEAVSETVSEVVSEEPSSEEESVAELPEYIDGKRVYGIKTFESLGAISWDSVEKAEIDTYKWVSSVEYEAYAQLVFVKDYGFICRMTCMESEPLANYTQFGDPVYLDSCMEFFAKWDNKSYINIESNSKGALCCQFGAAKAGRKPATDYLPLSQMFATNPVVEDGKWTLTMEIPIAKLQKFYGNSLTADTFISGYQFTGNFYKIGSDAVTGVRHYGMWNEVNGSSPDFHRPEDFGIFIMV